MTINRICAALNAAIRAAAQSIGGKGGKSFSRKSALTAEKVIHLLIGAEGGCLAKILHDADIQVTASALTQRHAQISPELFRSVFENFNSACTDGDLLRTWCFERQAFFAENPLKIGVKLRTEMVYQQVGGMYQKSADFC